MCKPVRMGGRGQTSPMAKPVEAVSVYLTACLPLSAAEDVRLPSGAKEHLGMLEYRREDEARLIQNLILGSETANSEFLLCL